MFFKNKKHRKQDQDLILHLTGIREHAKKNICLKKITFLEFSYFVGLIVAGPFRLFFFLKKKKIRVISSYLKSNMTTARISAKVSINTWSENQLNWVKDLLSPYMINPNYVESIEKDSRRTHLPGNKYYLFLTSTLEVFWPFYSIFYLTTPGVRCLTPRHRSVQC